MLVLMVIDHRRIPGDRKDLLLLLLFLPVLLHPSWLRAFPRLSYRLPPASAQATSACTQAEGRATGHARISARLTPHTASCDNFTQMRPPPPQLKSSSTPVLTLSLERISNPHSCLHKILQILLMSQESLRC